MRAMLDLLPIGIGVALVAALAWFLLDRDIGTGKWLLAGLLVAHGWVHLMFVFPTPEATTAAGGGPAYPFDMTRSWLITNAGLDAGLVRSVGIVVMVGADRVADLRRSPRCAARPGSSRRRQGRDCGERARA